MERWAASRLARTLGESSWGSEKLAMRMIVRWDIGGEQPYGHYEHHQPP